ncbi:MAG: hypothetical protein UT37_C0003G0039 [Parcubacteria group bacterium GW2011_GWA2_39_18]|nr:MAG: hypothetical protein UT37_C0003G0039 [Parcubacteria group bacterium GW2011_GWA2_39_18]
MTGNKIINGIIGVIIAVVLSLLLTLGIKVFYPEPEYPRTEPFAKEAPYLNVTCQGSDKECIAEQKKVEEGRQAYYKEQQKVQDEFEKTRKAYEHDLFIIANILGIIFFLAGMGLLSIYEKIGLNVVAGVLASGGFGIFYGYIRGWQGADDILKFIVGIVVAIMVVASAVVINNLVRKHNVK